METGIYSRKFIVQPDQCSRDASLSVPGVFNMLQALSAEHAQALGIGAAAMARQKKFWVTVHNRVDFTGRAWLLDQLTGQTWAEPCDPDSRTCFRGYALKKGEETVALARTQWAIINAEGEALPFRDSGFPEHYVFTQMPGISESPLWFEDDFEETDLMCEYTVQSTDIDFGFHMNNVVYVRKFLDLFPSDQILSSRIRSFEIHYVSPCKEQERLKIYRKQEGEAYRMCIRNAKGQAAVMASMRIG